MKILFFCLLLAAGLILSVPAYDVPCPYSERDFPLKSFAPDFRMPLAPESTSIVYPPSCRKAAEAFQAGLKEKTGILLPLHSGADSVNPARHMIAIGNFMNNPAMTELYKKRASFYDADLPGASGYAVHTSPSPWNAGAKLLLVGFSRDQDASAALNAALDEIPAGAKRIGAIRKLKSNFGFPKPLTADSMTRLFARTMANPEGVMPPYAVVGDQGLAYALTGDTAYALAFKRGFALILERAKKAGDWVPETWTFVYFDLSRIILTWRMIEEDPVFSAGDRGLICRVLWGLGRFTMTGPAYLKPEWLPEGEMRQNHPLFLAFSQYMVRQYFKERFGRSDFDPMVPFYTNAFAGQEMHYMGNDNGQGYLTLATTYAAAYLLHAGRTAFLEQGVQSRTADGRVITIDNLKSLVTYGDIGIYYPAVKSGFIEGPALTLAAWAGRDGACQWIYRWMTPAAPSMDGRTLCLGAWVSDVAPVYPSRYCGIFALSADTGVLRFAASRTLLPEHIADPQRSWLDKLSMRRAFDPEAEYLMLSGLSTLSHSHFDGNTINRLTWKRRIWLFEMDQFRPHAKHHNGVTIVRNGLSGEVPPLTELLFTHESDSMGITGTRVNRWNGADWTRFILWRKGRFFAVLDRVAARESGRYRLNCRFRSRGEATLKDDVWTVAQGDHSLRLTVADDAVRSLEFEPDEIKRNWKDYPYGRGTEILRRNREAELSPGGNYDFASLLTVDSVTRPASPGLIKAGPGLYRVESRDAEGLILLRGGMLPAGIERLEADVAWLNRNGIEACGLTLLRAGALEWRFAEPVQLSFVAATGKATVRRGAQAKTLSLTAPDLAAILAAARAQTGDAIRPETARRFVDFGFFPVKALGMPTAMTCAAPFNGGAVLGDADGNLRFLDNDTLLEWARLPRPLPVGFAAGLDIDGKPGDELLASALDLSDGALDSLRRKLIRDITLRGGVQNGRAFCFGRDGRLRWEQAVIPNYDDGQVTAVDMVRGKTGKPEILAAVINGRKLLGFSPADGKILFSPFVMAHRLTAVRVLEDGGDRKIITGNEYISPASAFGTTGRELWRVWDQMGSESKVKTEYMGYHLTAIGFQDVDGDNRREILFSTRHDRVYAVEQDHAGLLWQADVGDEALCLLALDTSRNNGPVSLVGTAGGDVVLLNRSGRRLNTLALGSAIRSLEKAAAPLPGRTDAVVLLFNGHVAVVDDLLKLRAYHDPGFQVLKLVQLRSGKGEVRLALIGDTQIKIIRHTPSIRKECRYY